MSRINLNSLIDEVLSMAKDSQSIRKKKRLDDETAQVNQSWDDTPAGQAYWKDIRGRNTALEVQKAANEGRTNIQDLKNQGAYDVADLRNQGTGQIARQRLGISTTNTNNSGRKGYDDIVTEIAKNDSTLFTDPSRKAELDNLGKNLKTMGFNNEQQQPTTLNEADIPTPEAIQSAHYRGMNDKEFRGAIDKNENLQGMGYVQNLKTGKTVRVVNNEVFDGMRKPQIQQNNIAPTRTAVLPPAPAPEQSSSIVPPEVTQAQRGYEIAIPLWRRVINAIGDQGSAESGVAPETTMPEQPIVIYNRNRNNELFKRKKKQEEEDVSHYLSWSKKNRF